MDKDAVNNALNKLDFLMGSGISLNGYGIRLLGVGFMDCSLPWASKRHFHDFHELHYVLEGECNTFLGEVEHLIGPNHYYVIGQGTMHSHKSQYHLGFSVRWSVGRNGERTDKDAENKMQNAMEQMEEAANRIAFDRDSRFFNKLLEIAGNSESCSSLISQLELVQLLLSIPRMMAFPEMKKKDLQASGANNEIVESCIRFIRENCLNDIGVNDVAGHVHLSYGHVSRLFKKHMGNTINREIMTARLFKSQHLLISTNESIDGIARRVGFNTAGYFTQTYVKMFRCTPSEYRRSHRRLGE